jgi:ketosteroid isomerase-like protein
VTDTVGSLDLELTDDAEQQNEVFTLAFNSGDGGLFDRLYHADAISNLSGQPLTGSARVEAIKQMLEAKPSLSATLREVYTTGDTRLLIVDFELEAPGEDGVPVKMTGSCTDVMTRDVNGRWFMAVDRPVIDEPAA